MLPTKSEDIRPRESEVGEAKQALLSLIVTLEAEGGYHKYLRERNPLPDSNRHPDLRGIGEGDNNGKMEV